MLINGHNYVYRDYNDLIIIFIPSQNKHIQLENVYCDFFRLQFEQKLSHDDTVSSISKIYGIDDYHKISKDLNEFNESLRSVFSDQDINNRRTTNNNQEDQINKFMAENKIPFSAIIEITDNCNLKCIHCYRGIKNKTFWTEQSFENTLRQLRDLGTLHLTITGGEPLVHKSFEKFLDLADHYGFAITIQTNATTGFLRLIEKLKHLAIEDISISLYSIDPSVHDAITKINGSHRKTIETIKELRLKNLPVTINCPVMKQNKLQVRAINNFAKSIKANCNFSFKIIHSSDINKDTASLNCFSSKMLFNLMTDHDIRLYNNIIRKINFSQSRQHYCDAGFRSITIDAQGNVLICNAFRKFCGNVEHTHISDIWENSLELTHWRKKTSLINDKCKNCNCYAYCEPCPAHYYSETGKDDQIDHLTCSFGQAFYAASKKAIPIINLMK